MSEQSKRVAIVTGAARGLGRGIAARLARDGYDVALNDLPSFEPILEELAKELSSTGQRIIAVPADVSKDEQVKGLVSKTVDVLGRLDVMVANAGLFEAKPFLQTTVEDLDQLYEVNTRGTFLCFKHAAQQMINEKHGGRLIAASSLAGHQGQATVSGYSSTKFAIRGIMQVASAELGKFGITANAYAPGTIGDTPGFIAAGEALGDPEGWRQTGAASTSVGFNGLTADIASLVSFLASEESRFITGECLH